MILRELQTNNFEKTVKEIMDLRVENSIFLDESYQVGTIERSRWGVREMRRFFKSIITGKAISPIVWIDVKACYEYWNACGISQKDTDYFKDKLDQGYTYISLDGNNRTITLYDIHNNKISLPAATYDLLEHPNIKVSRGYDKIKTLVKPLIDKFYKTKMSIVVYTDISVDEAGEVFRSINDGMNLNDQQKRQSYSSMLAQWIREKRKEFMKSLEKVFSEKNITILKADEFLAKCLCYTSQGSFDGSSLNEMYKNPGSTISRYLTKRDKWFQSTFNSFWKEMKSYKWTSKNSLLDLWIILSDYRKQNNTKIQDMKLYINTYYNNIKKLIGSSRTYDVSNMGTKELVLDYSGLLSKTLNMEAGKYRRNIIRNLVEKDLIDKNIITQLEDPENRFFTMKQKMKLHTKQDGVCPATKKRIPLEQIFDHTKWHADHILAYDKGGKTTIENGQLVCAEYNLRKGKK